MPRIGAISAAIIRKFPARVRWTLELFLQHFHLSFQNRLAKFSRAESQNA